MEVRITVVRKRTGGLASYLTDLVRYHCLRKNRLERDLLTFGLCTMLTRTLSRRNDDVAPVFSRYYITSNLIGCAGGSGCLRAPALLQRSLRDLPTRCVFRPVTDWFRRATIYMHDASR